MRLRECVRALILDPDDHVLLVRFRSDKMADGLWANPGGGVEPGETRLEAMQRELREEIGLSVESLGPEVWTKTAVFPMKPWDGRVDHIHLYRTERFRPTPALSPAELETEGILETRWWSPEELATQGGSFAPRSMPEFVERLRIEGIPGAPIAINEDSLQPTVSSPTQGQT